MARFVVGSREGGRSGALALFLLPLAGLLASCGPDAPSDDHPDSDFLVLAATPTNGQETEGDLSDPELDERITVRFSTTPARSTMIDETNAFNGLTPYVQMLDQNFARVPGTPSIDPDTHAFIFEPESNDLDNGQYTLTVSKFVATPTGNLLNAGIEDFSTSFTVGPDTYAPVVRNTSPAANNSDVPLFTPIVITMNESLDPASVVLGQTVFVQDGGTNPPTQQSGTLLLKRDGFDIVFVPDPCVGLQAGTTIVVRMLGVAPTGPNPNPTFVKDRVGNGLVGDPLNNYEVSFQFNTRGAKRVIPTVTPVVGNFRAGIVNGYAAMVSSNRQTVMLEMLGTIYEHAVFSSINPAFVQQVLLANPQPFFSAGPPSTWFYAGNWTGDWIVDFERAGEAIIDPRIDPNSTATTYIYQIDEAKEAVIIYDTFSKVHGKFKGLGTPRGISVSAPGAVGMAPVLYVTSYSQATLTAIPLATIQPGQDICAAVQELNDDISMRQFMQTGRNPSGVAMEFFGTPFGAVVNQADNEVQIFDASTLTSFDHITGGTLSETYQVGSNPIDCGWSFPINGGASIFLYIVNQGDADEPNGSVSLWWNNTSIIPLFNSVSGAVAATITDGIKGPGRPSSDPLTLSCWIPNTGDENVVRLDISVVGGFIGAAVTSKVGMSRTVGPNPTSVAWAGRITGFPLELGFATLAGLGQVAIWDKNAGIGPMSFLEIPGCRYVFAHWGQ